MTGGQAWVELLGFIHEAAQLVDPLETIPLIEMGLGGSVRDMVIAVDVTTVTGSVVQAEDREVVGPVTETTTATGMILGEGQCEVGELGRDVVGMIVTKTVTAEDASAH